MKCLYSVRHLLQQISLRKTLVTDKTQKKKNLTEKVLMTSSIKCTLVFWRPIRFTFHYLTSHALFISLNLQTILLHLCYLGTKLQGEQALKQIRYHASNNLEIVYRRYLLLLARARKILSFLNLAFGFLFSLLSPVIRGIPMEEHVESPK